MAWNHRSRVVAMAVAVQVAQGTFVQPSAATDLIAVSTPTNTHEAITADDPTATGTVWEQAPARLSKSATVGGTVPLRGPGGAAPPALGAWPVGRVLQAGGFAEIRKAAVSNAVLVAGSTTTALVLAATESGVDDFLLGAPVQQAAIGTGFRATTLVQDYVGATNTAHLAETLGGAPAAGAAYSIPPYLSYQLGTLTTGNVYLSISIWRDKKRYDYRDWQPSSIAGTMPVANDANTSFGDITFSGKGLVEAVEDDVSPQLPAAMLAVPVAPIRDGKFYLDRVKLGHQQAGFTINYTLGNASNQNQAPGQDGTDILSGNRQITLDLNQMAVADFDLDGRDDAQSTMPLLSTWGLGAGNRWGFLVPNMRIEPFSPGDRNGYVSLTGNAYSTDIDKSIIITIWW
jgi:hypothetical protein